VEHPSRECTGLEKTVRRAGRARSQKEPWPAKGDLGRAIRKLRGERRLTIEGLAFTAGIHPTYLSSVERGRSNPSWQTLCFLARALQIPLWDLVGRVESAARVREGFERVLAEENARQDPHRVRS
jgi:transcriptional regulator with XRE-family HTH domain